MRSLRSRLWLIWLLAVIASAGVGVLLVGLYRTTSTARLERGVAVVGRECQAVQNNYRFYTAGWDGGGADLGSAAFRRDLQGVVRFALAGTDVAGGIWSSAEGGLAEIGPAGTLGAARSLITEASREAEADQQSVLHQEKSAAGTLLVAACPLLGPLSGLSAWTLLRLPAGAGLPWLETGLALLLLLVLGIAGCVTWLTAVWGRHVRRIEAVLAAHDVEELPVLALTGERELDRILAALNDAGGRLARSRARAAEMTTQMARFERMAALGRVAAGVAHEIRNPVAAMRLRLENALAGDPARQRPALEASLTQIARVDRLIAELLAMTQRRTPQPEAVDLGQFLAERAEGQRGAAEQKGVRLEVACDARQGRFDREMIGRAIDNLLQNAIRHTPQGGSVRLSASPAEAGGVQVAVEDSGGGVDPALRPRLFEPFATGRPDGTGLGLAIAREMVEAHGGHLVLADGAQGARFVIALPEGTPCRPS